MKKLILFTGLTLMISLSSCGSSDKQSETKSNTKDAMQINEKKVSNLSTQQGFEKMLNRYDISLYPNLKFKSIKENNDGDIEIIYTVPDVSDESHEKVHNYIENEFSKLKNNGWDTMPAAHIAMKKENNKKVSIQINETYYKSSHLHELSITYGTVE